MCWRRTKARPKSSSLESPVLSNGMFERMLSEHLEGTLLSRSTALFAVRTTARPGRRALREALDRIRAEAEDAVRQGYSHLILTDERIERGACRRSR